MTTRIWTGGGNNLASNAKDWSPTGIPKPGDTLTMHTGTMNIKGKTLAGDSLTVDGGLAQGAHNATLNLTNATIDSITVRPVGPPETVTVDLKGDDIFDLNVSGDSFLTVNLVNKAQWTGGISSEGHHALGTLTVNGDHGASFMNTDSHFNESTPTIFNIDVGGIGTFNLSSSRIEFAKGVGAGQEVHVGPGRGFSSVTVDDPKDFHAIVRLDDGSVDLKGLANAASFTFKDDILTIYDSHKVIDTLRLVAPGGNISVGTTGSGDVIIASSGLNFLQEMPLPVHT